MTRLSGFDPNWALFLDFDGTLTHAVIDLTAANNEDYFQRERYRLANAGIAGAP